MPNIEHPDEFNRLVLEFLQQDRGPTNEDRG
jgi:hypothetical protein